MLGYFEKVENPMVNESVPFQDPIVGYCELCGGEIYDGEDVYLVDGSVYIHRDIDELEEYFGVKKGNLYVGGIFEK